MNEEKQGKEDPLLKGAVIVLVIVGLIVIYDASFPRSGGGQIARQAVWALVGVVAYLIGRRMSLRTLYRWAPLFALVALLMMLAVRFSSLGAERGGAYRWLKLGQVGAMEILVQPAEFGKIALIILLARLLCHSNMVSACQPVQAGRLPWAALIGLLIMAGVVGGVQEDLGTALVFCGIGMTMLFVAGVPFRWVALLTAVLAVATAFFIYQKEYRWVRIVAFTQPFAYLDTAGYQLAHSLMGIGTGGVWGTGLGMGRAKEFLPASETDFVFTTVAEETGIFGSTAIIALLALVSWRVFVIASKAQAMFLLLLGNGIGVWIALQTLLNLYVVVGAAPTTGVPLPFISYGGSSLVSLLFCIGLTQKIASNPMMGRIERQGHARIGSGRGNGRASVPRREYRRGVA
jgi:cell division protein FtsW